MLRPRPIVSQYRRRSPSKRPLPLPFSRLVSRSSFSSFQFAVESKFVHYRQHPIGRAASVKTMFLVYLCRAGIVGSTVELRHLRYFVAVAEAENVLRAAIQKLHVSQQLPIRTFSLLAQTDRPKRRRWRRTISRDVEPAGSFANSASDRSRSSGAFARSAWRKARRTPSASRLVQ